MSAWAYEGDPALRPTIEAALAAVVDPEMALSVADLGLVHAVAVQPERVQVTMTMTSAACPVAEVIVDDVEHEISVRLDDGRPVVVDLVWEPAWTPQDMSERARRFMGW